MIKHLLQKIKPIQWNDQTAKMSVRIANYVLAFAILAGFWVAGQAVRQPDKEAFASIMNIAKLPVWLTMASNNNNNNNNCTTLTYTNKGVQYTISQDCGYDNTIKVGNLYNASSESDSWIDTRIDSAINAANNLIFHGINVNADAAGTSYTGYILPEIDFEDESAILSLLLSWGTTWEDPEFNVLIVDSVVKGNNTTIGGAHIAHKWDHDNNPSTPDVKRRLIIMESFSGSHVNEFTDAFIHEIGHGVTLHHVTSGNYNLMSPTTGDIDLTLSDDIAEVTNEDYNTEYHPTPNPHRNQKDAFINWNGWVDPN